MTIRRSGRRSASLRMFRRAAACAADRRALPGDLITCPSGAFSAIPVEDEGSHGLLKKEADLTAGDGSTIRPAMPGLKSQAQLNCPMRSPLRDFHVQPAANHRPGNDPMLSSARTVGSLLRICRGATDDQGRPGWPCSQRAYPSDLGCPMLTQSGFSHDRRIVSGLKHHACHLARVSSRRTLPWEGGQPMVIAIAVVKNPARAIFLGVMHPILQAQGEA